MMVTALALGAALAYGAADFLGGAVARRSTALRAVALCVPTGLTVVLVAALLIGGSPSGTAMLWGLGAGLAGGTGLLVFYRALARGPMSVTAPVSALFAAVLPVAVGVLRGDRLSGGVLVGVALCLIAIALVSMESDPADAQAAPDAVASVPVTVAAAGQVHAGDRFGHGTVLQAQTDPVAPVRPRGKRWSPGLGGRPWRLLDNGPVMAGLSGVCFGTFLILLKEAGDDTGLWPLVASRVGNLLVVGIALIATVRLSGALPGTPVSGRLLIGLALLSGALDASANALYFVAAQQGVLSLAAVLSSLYPAVTVLLARIVYSERLRAVQRVGLVMAAAGVILVTAG